MAQEGRSAVAAALTRWIEEACAALEAPPPALSSARFAKQIYEAKLAGGRALRGKASAPLSLLRALFSAAPGNASLLQRVCLDLDGGSWNAVIKLLRLEGPARDRYLEVISALLAAGEDAEARLGWLQAHDIGDRDDRKAPLYAQLFAELPAAASTSTARSAAAYLQRQLPLAATPDPVDALIVAAGLYDHLQEALADVAGRRRASLAQQIETALASLGQHRELAVRDLAKLARVQYARIVALSADAP